jgi:N-acetylneuraminic acid mutarotase
LLQALKREFGYYCIDLSVEVAEELERQKMVYIVGGYSNDGVRLSGIERYDASLGRFSEMAEMGSGLSNVGTCVMVGELYVTGGLDDCNNRVPTVEKYSPLTDAWSAVAPMPAARTHHAAVSVGSAMYVLGGCVEGFATASVLVFDSTKGTRSHVVSMPAAIMGTAVCAVGSRIYVF